MAVKSRQKITFEEAVAVFRKRETVEDAACLIAPEHLLDSDGLRRLMIAWTKTKVTRKAILEEPNSEDLYGLWQWLWQQVEFSVEELSEISGVGSNVSSLWRILEGNHLVYPDGTISQLAQRMVLQVLKTRLALVE